MNFFFNFFQEIKVQVKGMNAKQQLNFISVLKLFQNKIKTKQQIVLKN